MITHHEGAVTMVEELLKQPGSAHDAVLFEFTTNVTNDQSAEIERMNALLVSLSDDPRAGLAAGLDDAEQGPPEYGARRLATATGRVLRPDNPTGLPPVIAEEDCRRRHEDSSLSDEEDEEDEEEEEDEFEPCTTAELFDNTDMAFFDDVLVAGSYHGFNIYRLGEDGMPKFAELSCLPGRPGRCVRRRPPADHVGRADPRTARLWP